MIKKFQCLRGDYMKVFNFSHWDLSGTTKGLLFFAQSLEEMLFHYGHDSLKVPALNFHFLCVEIHSTIRQIDADVVDKGNIRPLIEELKEAFSNDIIAQQMFGNDFNSLFFSKNASGDILRECDIFKDPTSDNSMKKIKNVINFLLTEIELEDNYYNLLKTSITDAITAFQMNLPEMDQIYQLSRSLLSELINTSYSQEYIYWVVNDVFYNRSRQIGDINETLELFWSSFDFREKKYSVTLPLSPASLRKHLNNFKNVSIKKNKEKLFDGSCDWVISLSVKAMDQHNAQSRAIMLVSFFVSLLQYNNHKSQSYNADQAIVTLTGTDKVFNLQTPITPLKRGKDLSDEKNNEKMALMVNNFAFSLDTLVSVVELHSSAINSADIGNQLLNLWTIIEVLVPTEPRGSFCKINQICNVMTTILNAQYIASLVEQFLADLCHCIPDIEKRWMDNVNKGQNDIEKIIAILVLPEYQSMKNDIVSALDGYPLMQYRIEYYSGIFSNRIRLKSFLAAHKKRLSWHIMRIYRSRNMIVHDGTHFPYIDIIVQNLHYYVDTLIDTINLYAGKGYTSLQTIYTLLQQKEFRHILLLEEKETNGSPKQISSECLTMVLGYLT